METGGTGTAGQIRNDWKSGLTRFGVCADAMGAAHPGTSPMDMSDLGMSKRSGLLPAVRDRLHGDAYRIFTGRLHSKGNRQAAEDFMIAATPPANAHAHDAQPARNPALWRAAIDLEATFLSLMLKDSGIGEVGAFGGGNGEAQFSSFLRDAYAREMADAGGIGLAETLFRALQARADAA